MAYNNYFPQYYQPMQQAPLNQPQTAQNAPAAQSSGIIWVQGEAAAKAYPVAPGQAVLLMDAERSVMYIKSTDMSGMPQPLRIFDYAERTVSGSEPGIARKSQEEFVLRSEFEEFKEEIQKNIKGIRTPRIEKEEE